MGQYGEFTNKITIADGDALNPTTQINQQTQGIQDEFELRDGDGWVDGVASGLAVTTNGTSSITVASGRGYAAGKRYKGGESLTITGYPAGTYSAYYNSANDTTTLAATTASLSSGQLKLATFTWDGSGTASTSCVVTDGAKVKGLYRIPRDVVFSGLVATTSKYVLPYLEDTWIERVDTILQANNGTSGNVVVDASIGADGAEGTTIFTTQTLRPSIAALGASYTLASSGVPDGTRVVSAGQHLTVAIDEVFGVGTASNLTVTVHGRPV